MSLSANVIIKIDPTIREIFTRPLFSTGELWISAMEMASLVSKQLNCPGSGGMFYNHVVEALDGMVKACELESSKQFIRYKEDDMIVCTIYRRPDALVRLARVAE